MNFIHMPSKIMTKPKKFGAKLLSLKMYQGIIRKHLRQVFIENPNHNWRKLFVSKLMKQIFNQFWIAFWLQFEIALPLDPFQEHVLTGPEFVINSHVSAMRFLKDSSSKSTTFASKKTPKLILKTCKNCFYIASRFLDPHSAFFLSKIPSRPTRSFQEVSKMSPSGFQDGFGGSLQDPKIVILHHTSIKNQVF